MTNGTLLNKKSAFFEKNQTIVKVSIDGDKNFHDLNRPFKKKSKKI
jgi:sulfatase maturation enzyme AslB (radical SAM superfamily)